MRNLPMFAILVASTFTYSNVKADDAISNYSSKEINTVYKNGHIGNNRKILAMIDQIVDGDQNLIYKQCRVGVSSWECPDDKECDYDTPGCK